MRLPHVQKRNGFTLIELLVVIAILALLMALTLGVMSKVYQFMDETKVTTEVGRLAQGCEQFKATFGRYPPGKIILCENPAAYTPIINGLIPPPPGYTLTQFQQLGAFSVEYLSSIFPGINLTGAVLHDWNGNGSLDGPTPPLEGQQCLVFFLGGMHYGTSTPFATTGFNTDKTLPTVQTNGARLGPFYEFDGGRLTTAIYPAYLDPYGTLPYAYFASKTQGMNNYPNAYFPVINQQPNDCHILTTSLTSTGTLYFVPYFQGTVPVTPPASWLLPATLSFKFHKTDTFQIVSAGKDKQFGTGGQYNQADPEQSLFLPSGIVPAADQASLQANYDNITSVTNGRVVPK